MIGAVVLAAGLGRRFGGVKVLEQLEGRALVRHVVERVAAAGLSPTVVVTGASHHQVVDALRGTAATTVRNPLPDAGLSASLRLGVRALPEDVTAFLIALGDQPLIAPSTIGKLVDGWQSSAPAAVVPHYRNADWGHPILVDASLREQFAELSGDAGARALLQSLGDRVLRLRLEGDAPRDVDTRADLKLLAAEAGDERTR